MAHRYSGLARKTRKPGASPRGYTPCVEKERLRFGLGREAADVVVEPIVRQSETHGGERCGISDRTFASVGQDRDIDVFRHYAPRELQQHGGAAIHGNLPNQTALITQIPSHPSKALTMISKSKAARRAPIMSNTPDEGGAEVNLIGGSSKSLLRD